MYGLLPPSKKKGRIKEASRAFGAEERQPSVRVGGSVALTGTVMLLSLMGRGKWLWSERGLGCDHPVFTDSAFPSSSPF